MKPNARKSCGRQIKPGLSRKFNAASACITMPPRCSVPTLSKVWQAREFILSTVCWSRNPNPDQQKKQARPVQVKPGQRCSLRSVSRAGGLIPESRLPACFAGNKQRSACVGAILALVGLPGISAICRLRNPKMVKPLDGFFDRIGPIYRVFPIQQMSISYSGIPF